MNSIVTISIIPGAALTESNPIIVWFCEKFSISSSPIDMAIIFKTIFQVVSKVAEFPKAQLKKKPNPSKIGLYIRKTIKRVLPTFDVT